MFGLKLSTIAIGIAAAILIGYISFLKIDLSIQTSEKEEAIAEFAAYRKTNEANAAAWKSSNDALTLKLKQQGIDELQQIAKNKDDNDAKIRAQKLNGVLTAQLVELLNANTQATAQPNVPTTTVSGHASGTDPAPAIDTPFTEEDWALTTNENNANHMACVKQVKKWQGFWNDFVTDTRNAGG